MAALNSMCALSNTAVELEKRKSKKAAESCCAAASSSASACSASTERWSKETLKAVETHLSLLQKNRVPASIAKLATSHASPLIDFSSHSQAPLPSGWEQHLDLRTGRIYYMDWQSCKRSYNDPREALWKANERIHALVQRAVDGQSPEPQSSVTQEALTTAPECISHHSKLKPLQEELGVEVESERTSTVRATERACLESMEAEIKQTANAKSACSFTGDTEPYPSADAQSKWSDPDAAPSHTFNCKDHGVSTLGRFSPKLEMLRCHRCFSHITIHFANPWCPQCAHSLV